MPSASENTSKWRSLSEIDYFSLFMKSWFAFNAWYKGHYPNENSDRDCINNLKDNADIRNSVYSKFQRLLEGTDREAIKFKDNLEGFITSLNTVTLHNPNEDRYAGRITFQNALIDIQTRSYQNLIRERKQHNKIQLASIYVVDDESLFNGTIEIIYQIRCLLFHGHIEPDEHQHKIIQYAYLVLNALLQDL